VAIYIGFANIPTEHGGPTKGVGLLQGIWLWRNHPELSYVLRDTKQRSEINLCNTGLKPVRLCNRVSVNTHGQDSFSGEQPPHGEDSNSSPSILAGMSHGTTFQLSNKLHTYTLQALIHPDLTLGLISCGSLEYHSMCSLSLSMLP
jgi:hypothetical protein